LFIKLVKEKISHLQEILSIKKDWIQSVVVEKRLDTLKEFQNASQMQQYRVHLVHDLVSIFRLRKVHRTIRQASGPMQSIEYRIVNVGFPVFNSLPSLSSKT
jgi:hypothetical protein